jgi:periplasmic protein TonB
MNFIKINENQTIWLALTASLLIHGLVFSFSEKSFIQQAQYSVQPSAQMVEVSIETVQADAGVVASEAKVLMPDTRNSSQSFNSKKIASSASPPRNDTLPYAVEGTGNIDTSERSRMTHARKPFDTNSGVKVKANPDYYQNPPPEYPELAKQMRQEGLVMLAVEVDREGAPVMVEILKSSGFHLLDQAALKAVRHWKFQPGKIGDLSVESNVTVPIRFYLHEQI